jgi:hydroxyethylthiazole kinase-like uncharacterized protein yjeF
MIGPAPYVNAQVPELMCGAAQLALRDRRIDAIVCGPGLGVDDRARGWLVRCIAHDTPLVVDADGLNLLAADAQLMNALRARVGATVLTPHPLEAARLLNCSLADVMNDRVGAAVALAGRSRAHVLLKGAGTIHASARADALSWSINASGSPALATAGTGDVLTGVVAALLAQGLEAGAAAGLAAWAHGRAGEEIAERNGGPIGATASEIARAVRCALNRLLISR